MQLECTCENFVVIKDLGGGVTFHKHICLSKINHLKFHPFKNIRYSQFSAKYQSLDVTYITDSFIHHITQHCSYGKVLSLYILNTERFVSPDTASRLGLQS